MTLEVVLIDTWISIKALKRGLVVLF